MSVVFSPSSTVEDWFFPHTPSSIFLKNVNNDELAYNNLQKKTFHFLFFSTVFWPNFHYIKYIFSTKIHIFTPKLKFPTKFMVFAFNLKFLHRAGFFGSCDKYEVCMKTRRDNITLIVAQVGAIR